MSGTENSFCAPIEHKNSPIGPQKATKLSQIQMSEFKETKNMKIIALYE